MAGKHQTKKYQHDSEASSVGGDREQCWEPPKDIKIISENIKKVKKIQNREVLERPQKWSIIEKKSASVGFKCLVIVIAHFLVLAEVFSNTIQYLHMYGSETWQNSVFPNSWFLPLDSFACFRV